MSNGNVLPTGKPFFSTFFFRTLSILVISGLYCLTIAYAIHKYVDFDEAIYLMMAKKITMTGCPMNVILGDLFVDNPPLIPYFVAALHLVGIESTLWIQSFYITIFVLPGWIGLYFLGSRMFHHPAVGLLAVIAFSTRIFVFQESARVKLDIPLASISTLFFLCLYELESPRSPGTTRLARIGLACFGAIACLIKHQGVLLPITGMLYLLIRRRQTKGSTAFVKWITAGVVIAGMVWLFILFNCWDQFHISQFGRNLMRILYRTDEPWFHIPLDVFWIEVARKVLGPVLLGGLVVSLLLWRIRLLTDNRLLLLSLWFLLALVFCSSIGLKSSRYFISATPAAALLVASLASVEAWEVFASRWKHSVAQFVRFSFITIVVVAFTYYIYFIAISTQRPESTYFKDMGMAIQEVSTRDERVLLSHPEIAFYANRDFVLTQFGKRFEQIYDPRYKIHVYVEDSTEMFYSNVSMEERRRFEEYRKTHFRLVPNASVPAPIYRRIR